MRKHLLGLFGAALVLSVGSLIAPTTASATTITNVIQLDDLTDTMFADYLIDGVVQSHFDCGTNENCSLAAGFFVSSPTAAVNITVNFNVYDPDGTTLSDFGTALFRFEPNGSLQDFGISLNSDFDGLPFTSPFTAADNPISLIETGAYQTVLSAQGIVDSDGNTHNVFLQFRSDADSEVPEPGTLALIAAGLLSLGALGLIRRRAAA